MRKWMLAVPLLALAGCSIGQDVPLAEGGVVTVHQQLNAGKCDEVRATAGAEFRQAATNETWRSLCSQIMRGLGKFVSGKQSGWQDNFVNGDHQIGIAYDSVFEKGKGTERFLFRIVDGKPVLLGYHVNSPVFDDPPAPGNAAEPANAAG